MNQPEKTRLLEKIAAIPAMERGKLSPHSSGRHLKLQCWQEGKNHTRHVPAGELPAVQRALAGYTQYRQLTEQYADLVIQETRQNIAGAKKKESTPPPILLAQEEEIQQLIGRFEAGELHGQSVAQLEILVRTAVFQSANALVGWLLQKAAARADASDQPQPGQTRKGRETIGVQGIFGRFQLERDYYYHAGKDQGHSPADAALGLEVGYAPALAKLICLEGADEPTHLKAERHLEQTGGMAVSARQIQRVVQRVGGSAQQWQERQRPPGQCDAPVLYVSADGTGVPMAAPELKGRRGKQADGTAKTRQVYLGCVFTQHRTDENGHPVRDYESTTCVSSFQSIDEFGPLLRQEAIGRGLGSADKVVLLIDGATGLENMGRLGFKDCVQIVDFYHAMEHAGQVLEALIGKTHPDYKKRLRRWAKRLLKDKVQSLVQETCQQCAGTPQEAAVKQALGYFVRNVSRMQYGTFRAAGWFIGSGVVEAGCKTVIGGRCKQSGMFWSKTGAENILALRCIHSSRRWEDFWKYRLNHHAAGNDTLPLAA